MANLTYDEMVEVLAELEHEQWLEWSANLTKNESLSLERLARWSKMRVPYSDLTEEQKEQDRVWARKVLDRLLATL